MLFSVKFADSRSVYVQNGFGGIQIQLHGEIQRAVLRFNAGVLSAKVEFAVFGGESNNFVLIVVGQLKVNAVFDAGNLAVEIPTDKTAACIVEITPNLDLAVLVKVVDAATGVDNQTGSIAVV